MSDLIWQKVEKNIVREEYYKFPGTNLTVCCLVLRNGVKVLGTSDSDIRIPDEKLQRDCAREDARHKVFELEGYVARSLAAG